MMTTQVFQRGETVPMWAETRNANGELFNPTPAGVKVTLKKPDGTIAKDDAEDDIDDAAMSQTSTGIFVYYYKSIATDPIEWWHYSCKAVDGAGEGAKTVITHGSFKLN